MRKIMDEFTEPLMKEALATREKRLLEKDGKSLEGDETTLLEHLINRTQDPAVLKDEVTMSSFNNLYGP
jgi:hypothetical protein